MPKIEILAGGMSEGVYDFMSGSIVEKQSSLSFFRERNWDKSKKKECKND